jgi:N-acyl-L-homoserine lactone synthetase
MNTVSNIKTSVYNSQTMPENIFMQYGKLRYMCFRPDDPNVNMDHRRKIEMDRFDVDRGTFYITVVESKNSGRQENLLSAVRLRSTLLDYELEMDSYKYLTRDITLPKSDKIMEGNRWVGKSSNSAIGKFSTAMLLTKLFELSRELEFNKIIGTISTLGQSWLNKRQIVVDKNSNIYHVDEDNIDILISTFDVDNNLLNLSKKLFSDAIHDLSIESISLKPEAA